MSMKTLDYLSDCIYIVGFPLFLGQGWMNFYAAINRYRRHLGKLVLSGEASISPERYQYNTRHDVKQIDIYLQKIQVFYFNILSIQENTMFLIYFAPFSQPWSAKTLFYFHWHYLGVPRVSTMSDWRASPCRNAATCSLGTKSNLHLIFIIRQ